MVLADDSPLSPKLGFLENPLPALYSFADWMGGAAALPVDIKLGRLRGGLVGDSAPSPPIVLIGITLLCRLDLCGDESPWPWAYFDMLGRRNIEVCLVGFKLGLGPFGFTIVGGAMLLASDSVAWSC